MLPPTLLPPSNIAWRESPRHLHHNAVQGAMVCGLGFSKRRRRSGRGTWRDMEGSLNNLFSFHRKHIPKHVDVHWSSIVDSPPASANCHPQHPSRNDRFRYIWYSSQHSTIQHSTLSLHPVIPPCPAWLTQQYGGAQQDGSMTQEGSTAQEGCLRRCVLSAAVCLVCGGVSACSHIETRTR